MRCTMEVGTDSNELIETPPIQWVNNSRVGMQWRPFRYAPRMYISESPAAGKLIIRADTLAYIDITGLLDLPSQRPGAPSSLIF